MSAHNRLSLTQLEDRTVPSVFNIVRNLIQDATREPSAAEQAIEAAQRAATTQAFLDAQAAALEASKPKAMDRAPGSEVALLNSDGTVRQRVSVYDSSFTGGMWVASADVNGDGTADMVVAPGAGRGSDIRVIDGLSGASIASFLAYESSFIGGSYAVAADLNGDGKAEIITGTDQGGGPRVRVFDGASVASGAAEPTVLADFFAIDDPEFRGGVRVTLGDLNRDGISDLVVSAGFGGGPRIAGYDGAALAQGQKVPLFSDFFAFEPELRNGAYPAVGDTDGDGYGDLIVGAGPGGGPRVKLFDGKAMLGNELQVRRDSFAGSATDRTGVRVAAIAAADGRSDILTISNNQNNTIGSVTDGQTGLPKGSGYSREVVLNGGMIDDHSGRTLGRSGLPPVVLKKLAPPTVPPPVPPTMTLSPELSPLIPPLDTLELPPGVH